MTVRKYILLFFVFIGLHGFLFAQERKDALELYRNGTYLEAVNECLIEIQNFSDAEVYKRMDAYTVLNWSLLALGQYNDVVKYGEEALRYISSDYRVIMSLGQAHYYLGNNIESLGYFEQYTKLSGSMNIPADDVASVYALMGELYLRFGEYHHADIAFSTAVYFKPVNARWWLRLGYARELAADYEWSISAYDKALSLNPALADALRGKERVEALQQDEA